MIFWDFWSNEKTVKPILIPGEYYRDEGKNISSFEIWFLKVTSFLLNYMSCVAVQIIYIWLSFIFNVRNTMPISNILIPPTYSSMLKVASFYDKFRFIFDTWLDKKHWKTKNSIFSIAKLSIKSVTRCLYPKKRNFVWTVFFAFFWAPPLFNILT